MKSLIIGVGNVYRNDDGVGILIVRKLKNRVSDYSHVKEQSGEGTSLMDAWSGYGRVCIVDAVSSGSPAGIIHRMDVSSESIPANFFSCSTHSFGVAEAIELARTLGQLPSQLQLYGIEGGDFQPGEFLSAEVERVVESVVDEIVQYVSSS
ncbi:MAG: hydrogenase maturation protease [Nitrospinaceae bacterium]|jgi:hydrogenase maturation protease|nr:hydrogenase maturation protease [Nitrospinaceae bacterium]MBT6347296.1 hydrogenase maturation protease [Nitrospina sp.]